MVLYLKAVRPKFATVKQYPTSCKACRVILLMAICKLSNSEANLSAGWHSSRLMKIKHRFLHGKTKELTRQVSLLANTAQNRPIIPANIPQNRPVSWQGKGCGQAGCNCIAFNATQSLEQRVQKLVGITTSTGIPGVSCKKVQEF